MAFLESWASMGRENQVENGKSLCIAGVYQGGSRYPNVEYKVKGLLSSEIQAFEINNPAFGAVSSWGEVNKTASLLVSAYKVFWVLIKCINRRNEISTLYAPYPSIFLCFCLSMLPRRLRPYRIVCDLFISLYDTVIFDRKLLSKNSLMAKILWWVEFRSLSIADVIVVDTPQNAHYIARLFGIDSSRLVSVPLSIGPEENAVKESVAEETLDNDSAAKTFEVLFVGTMIPLHGIKVILKAASLLMGENLHFTIVGQGQEGYLVQEYLNKYGSGNLTWIPDWQSNVELSKKISEADVCLGIFSEGKKAQRVCPLKLYHYMQSGKVIVTGDTDWARSVLEDVVSVPFLVTPVGDGVALSKILLSLSRNSGLARELEVSAKKFYKANLENAVGLELLKKYLA